MNNIPLGKKLLVKGDYKIEHFDDIDIKENYNRKKLMRNINN